MVKESNIKERLWHPNQKIEELEDGVWIYKGYCW